MIKKICMMLILSLCCLLAPGLQAVKPSQEAMDIFLKIAKDLECNETIDSTPIDFTNKDIEKNVKNYLEGDDALLILWYKTQLKDYEEEVTLLTSNKITALDTKSDTYKEWCLSINKKAFEELVAILQVLLLQPDIQKWFKETYNNKNIMPDTSKTDPISKMMYYLLNMKKKKLNPLVSDGYVLTDELVKKVCTEDLTPCLSKKMVPIKILPIKKRWKSWFLASGAGTAFLLAEYYRGCFCDQNVCGITNLCTESVADQNGVLIASFAIPLVLMIIVRQCYYARS